MWLHALRVVRPRQASRGRRGRCAAVGSRPGPSGAFRPLPENERSGVACVRAERLRAGRGVAARPRSSATTAETCSRRRAPGGDPAALAAAWAAAHPPRVDDAWHPYTASTRAANWIAAATLDPSLAPVVAEGIRRALARVARERRGRRPRQPRDPQCASRSCSAGVAFDDRRCARRGDGAARARAARAGPLRRRPLRAEPAYHPLVLRDLLERARDARASSEPIERMLGFAAASSRPDGAPALFNDGGARPRAAARAAAPTTASASSPRPATSFVREGGAVRSRSTAGRLRRRSCRRTPTPTRCRSSSGWTASRSSSIPACRRTSRARNATCSAAHRRTRPSPSRAAAVRDLGRLSRRPAAAGRAARRGRRTARGRVVPRAASTRRITARGRCRRRRGRDARQRTRSRRSCSPREAEVEAARRADAETGGARGAARRAAADRARSCSAARPRRRGGSARANGYGVPRDGGRRADPRPPRDRPPERRRAGAPRLVPHVRARQDRLRDALVAGTVGEGEGSMEYVARERGIEPVYMPGAAARDRAARRCRGGARARGR